MLHIRDDNTMQICCKVFFWDGLVLCLFFFFSSRRRHTRFDCDWSSDVCSSDLGEPVNRTALADVIVKVSQLVTDFPEIVELDLNPVFATAKDAIAADVRIVVDFAYKPKPKPRPTEEIVAAMSRIMQPKAVAVIGASAEDGKIGNSVMKNLINGGYKGDLYPNHPQASQILRFQAHKSVKDVPGVIDVAVFAIPAKFVAGALTECGE